MKKGFLRPLFSPFGISQLIMVAAVAAALWMAYGPWRWERAKDDVRNRYPNTPRIDAMQLKEWFDRGEGVKPVVIDVRSQAEYDFSRLPGAKHMGISETPAKAGIGEKTDVPLVIYDAIGADSSAAVESLVQLKYRHVQALEGGIFEWALQGKPMEGPTGPVAKVNPGTSPNAKLLKRSLRAP